MYAIHRPSGDTLPLRARVVLLAVGLLVALLPAPVVAETTLNASNEAELRDAIFQASNDFAVDGTVDDGPYTINITGDITLSRSLPMIRGDAGHPITIDGGGTYASIVNSGAYGIIVNFTANDSYGNTVFLRGLTLYGDQTFSGVRITGTVPTHVTISDCTFVEQSTAVDIQPGTGASGQR